MKIRGTLCLVGLIGFISDGHTRIIDMPDKPDPREGKVGGGGYPKEEVINNHKPESHSFLKESSESLTISKDEIEKPETYVIITTEKASSAGGGVLSLDPQVIAEMVLPPFPEAEVPWWEHWWNSAVGWFAGENAESKPGEQP